MEEFNEQQIIDFLQLRFAPIDNIPENIAYRDSVCQDARASFLIDNASLDELSLFFNTRINNNVLRISLSAPCVISVNGQVMYHQHSEITVEFKWHFSAYCVTPHWSKDYFGVDGRWHIDHSVFDSNDSKALQLHAKKLLLNLKSTTPYVSWGDTTALDICFSCLCKEMKKHFETHSTFQLVRQSTQYDTPWKVCHFFHNDLLTFSPLSLSHRNLQCEDADSSCSLKIVVPGQSEMESIHNHLASMFTANRLPSALLEYSPKQYEGLQQFIFPFKDQHDHTVMTVLKCYTDTYQRKCFLPVTCWKVRRTLQQYCMAVPSEKKSPLFHLKELETYPAAPAILTDSLEIAALNQAKIEPAKLIFSSFICDQEHYEQVDWSPLKGRNNLYLFVSNHSGKTFEEACLTTGKLADYLKSLSIEPLFIRVPVYYRPLPVLNNMQELISAYKATPPEPYKEEIRILTLEEFEMLRQTAAKKIGRRPEAWWETKQEQEERTSKLNSSESNSSTDDKFDYILWPLLIRRTSTMLYARKSLGKSRLAHAMAACLSAYKKPRLFEENWWGATKGNYNTYKILYLDFENGKTTHDNICKEICHPYWRTEASKQAEDKKNFIWKNMPELGLTKINYALPENHQKLMDMLDAATDEGEPGHPVDVLVIDHYCDFTANEDYDNTTRGMRVLVEELNKRDIATLVLNHPQSDNDKVMYGRKEILKCFFYVMYLERQGQGQKSKPLSEPIEVHFNAVRSGWLATNQESFKMYQPGSSGKWHLYSPERSATDELERIKDCYMKADNFSKEEVATLLGTSAASLYRSINNKDEA